MSGNTKFRNTAPLRALAPGAPGEEDLFGDLLGGDGGGGTAPEPSLDALLGGEATAAAPAPAPADPAPSGVIPLEDAAADEPLIPMSLDAAGDDESGPELLEIEGDPLGPAALAPADDGAPDPVVEIESEPEPESADARRIASLTRLLTRAREDQAALEKQLATARTERDRALRELELRTDAVNAAEAVAERLRAESAAVRGHLEGKLEQARRDGPESLIHEMIPVVDYLDMALRAAPPGDPLVQGVELTRRAMIDALARFDARAVGAEGDPFDPRIHDAAAAEVRPDLTAATVIELLRRGWVRGGKTLRPAMVKVGRPPEPANG